jgi:molybdopterin synthase catalytic subunit
MMALWRCWGDVPGRRSRRGDLSIELEPQNPVRINVKLFAILRDTAGVAELSLDLPQGAKVHDAAAALALAHPAIAPHLTHSAYAVNRTYAGPSQVLQEGDELAAIPPVSGG